ncbi:ribonuclease H-like domain-containing protein [Tanacetum coccineum]
MLSFLREVFPFKIKHSFVEKASQDLDHVNFFNKVVHEGPDTSYDDNDLSAQDQDDGSNSTHFSSLTIDQFEDELGHPQGSNGSASEDEMTATCEKWVFKIKYKSNGEIERYKARYVVKWYNQKEGVDFDETFSPVVKIVTVRCLNLAVQNDWNSYQLDINNVFLYGELSETVYMDLPEGFYSPDDKRVCKLKKYLYGLK